MIYKQSEVIRVAFVNGGNFTKVLTEKFFEITFVKFCVEEIGIEPKNKEGICLDSEEEKR